MRRYRVYLIKSMTYAATVEAESPEDAVQQALDGGTPGLCTYCSRHYNTDSPAEVLTDVNGYVVELLE